MSLRNRGIMSFPSDPLDVTQQRARWILGVQSGFPQSPPLATPGGPQHQTVHHDEGAQSWRHGVPAHNLFRISQNEERRDLVGPECPGCPWEPGRGSPRERKRAERQEHTAFLGKGQVLPSLPSVKVMSCPKLLEWPSLTLAGTSR